MIGIDKTRAEMHLRHADQLTGFRQRQAGEVLHHRPGQRRVEQHQRACGDVGLGAEPKQHRLAEVSKHQLNKHLAPVGFCTHKLCAIVGSAHQEQVACFVPLSNGGQVFQDRAARHVEQVLKVLRDQGLLAGMDGEDEKIAALCWP